MNYEQWKKKKISRKEEAGFPDFKSHDEARAYFKEKYGYIFQMMDSFMIDDQKCYTYKLLFDVEAFLKGQEELNKNGFTISEDFMFCCQDIQIMEDGYVHVVH